MATLLVFLSPWPKLRGVLRSLWRPLGGHSPPWAPALAVQAPAFLPESTMHNAGYETPSFLENILWMAVPKKRRTIEVNRCRRRNVNKLIKLKSDIDVCPNCGSLKQKHILCGYCYEKVKLETSAIRKQMGAMEDGPHRSPTVETVVLYKGENPKAEDIGKRIIERNRKRPSWFTLD